MHMSESLSQNNLQNKISNKITDYNKIPRNETDLGTTERYFREHHITAFLANGFQKLYSTDCESSVFAEYSKILDEISQKEPYRFSKQDK